MLVTLAYPRGKHRPDETIEVDEVTGRELVRDGLARLPDPSTFEDLNVTELRSYAATNGIDLGGARTKSDMAAAIQVAEQQRIPSSSPISTPAPVGPET